MNDQELEEEIARRIAAALEAGRQVEGVLFHGTAEEIEGGLKPGGDGTLWTSDSPVIAQQYIPASGIESIRSKPMDYELDSRVLPNLNDTFYGLARRISGLEITDVERDHMGQAKSWAVPEGWPTYGDVVRYVEQDLGYDPGRFGSYSLKVVTEGGKDRVMPAGWKMAGQLFMTLADGLDLKDVRQASEPDLSLYEHNNVGAFRAAAAEGRDGVVINDFAQTDQYGNFGHLSFGLNRNGLAKVKWVSIPATRFDLNDIWPFPIVTPDVRSWLDGLVLDQPFAAGR